VSGNEGTCVWITGPPRAGSSTIARIVVGELRAAGRPSVLLDEAEVREHLAAGEWPARRALRWLVGLLVDNGVTAVVAVPSGADERDALRDLVTNFVEVFVDTPSDVCATRGAPVDAPYEDPLAPELRVLTHDRAADASAAQVVSYLESRQD
jgi:adenylylsulfate kinase